MIDIPLGRKCRSRLIVGSLVACICALDAVVADAWENTCTHPHIIDQANVMLNGNPAISFGYGFEEYAVYLSTIETGSTIEDNPIFVAVDHFYDPKDGLPLHTENPNDNSYLEQLSDGGPILDILGRSPDVPQMTALARGEIWFQAAITNYRERHKKTAYIDLGRAAHLLTGDMGQPAHTQNDPHVPYFTFVQTLIHFLSPLLPHYASALTGADHSPLEGSAEQMCVNNAGAFPSGDAFPSNIQMLTGRSELDLATSLAKASYSASTFVGDKAFGPIVSPLPSKGSELLPLVGYIGVGSSQVPVFSNRPIPGEPSFECLGTDHFEINPINPNDPVSPLDRVMCYDPLESFGGTLDSGLTNDWWNINFIFPMSGYSDFSSWDPNLGANEYYFHFYNQIPYGSGNLNAFLLPQQLRKSIDYTAALLKEFARQVAPTPPDVQVQENDANGNTIGQNGSTSVGTVYVTATARGSPTDAGIGYLGLDALDSSGQNVTGVGSNVLSITQSSPGIDNDLPSVSTYTFAVAVPSSGQNYYQIHAVDGLGNHSYSTFTVTSASNGNGDAVGERG